METTELFESIKTIESVISKLEKCAPKIKASSAQSTLLQKRLSAFNLSISLITFYSNLLETQGTIIETLEQMKAEDKEKTVRYRELFGQKLINKSIIESIQCYVK